MKRRSWILIAAGLVLAGLGGLAALRRGEDEVKWRTAPIERGDIRQRISATGTLSALVQVNVGTQVSGTIADLFVDYNSKVSKGQAIAQIDPTLFQAAVEDALANVSKAETAAGDAKRQYARAQRLHEQKLISDQDLEAAQVASQRTQGDLLSARAALSKAKANLGYCTIKAPVSGVVVSRAVDVGQTVAASFNTPTLFVIAQDLTKMKMLAAIDEADIGQVQPGQKGQFTVDSFPEEQFRGTVSQVRLEPVVSQNVVTYNVQIGVDNADLKLRPGMTANVSILTKQKDGVLKVPSSALRFNPLAFMPAGQNDISRKRVVGGGGSQGETSTPQPNPAGSLTTGEPLSPRRKMQEARSGSIDGEPIDQKERKKGGQGKGRDRKAGSETEGEASIPNGNAGEKTGSNAALGNHQQSQNAPSPAAAMIPGSDTSGRANDKGGPENGVLRGREGQLWILKGKQPTPVPVMVGITDGRFTEVSGEGIVEGLQVIIGVADTKKTSNGAAAPLGARMGRP